MNDSGKLFSTEDIEDLLRQTDFSSENSKFKSQLRNRFKNYLEDSELTDEELSNLAAAKSDLLLKKFLHKTGYEKSN